MNNKAQTECVPTPHIEAKQGEIAKTILLPGDPLRAKVIAEKFLTNYKLVSSVRNNYCYTGFYKGVYVSIMATGMGCASMGIYSYELFKYYDVENAIRIGTMGVYDSNYKIGDIVLAQNTISDTNYLNFFKENGMGKISCSNTLQDSALKIARSSKKNIKPATVFTTDTFYDSDEAVNFQKSLGVIGVEMECAALYLNAKKFNKQALTLCTVTDEFYSNKKASSSDRQNLFLDMALLALDLAVSL